MKRTAVDTKRVAVVGSGISGLAAAYLLSRRHQVTLYEKLSRLGGHTHTVTVTSEAGPLRLDTGFLVHNRRTYPNLVRLFDEVGIDTDPSEMSFSVSCPSTDFEYSSRGVRGFFAQPRHVFRRSHYELLRDILRFNREAPALVGAGGALELTLGEYLRDRRYSSQFVERYLMPMASAIWSSPIEAIDRFPARTFTRFMHNHGLLSLSGQPRWRVVRGGSASYIPRLTAPLAGRVRLNAGLRAIVREGDGVRLRFAERPDERVDEVVLACHGDQVLPLLADATQEERAVFGAFTTTPNEAWLHTDAAMLPRSARARASWNYRLGAPDQPPSVTYDLTRLQSLRGRHRYCVTLNPAAPIDERHVINRFHYRHPRFTTASLTAQARWDAVSGVRHTHYCGAYWRYGFHEDGLWSAIRVARVLGVAW